MVHPSTPYYSGTPLGVQYTRLKSTVLDDHQPINYLKSTEKISWLIITYIQVCFTFIPNIFSTSQWVALLIHAAESAHDRGNENVSFI